MSSKRRGFDASFKLQVVQMCCSRRIIDPGADAVLTQPSHLKGEMQQRVRGLKQG